MLKEADSVAGATIYGLATVTVRGLISPTTASHNAASMLMVVIYAKGTCTSGHGATSAA